MLPSPETGRPAKIFAGRHGAAMCLALSSLVIPAQAEALFNSEAGQSILILLSRMKSQNGSRLMPG
jgi:hypothetical protein